MGPAVFFQTEVLELPTAVAENRCRCCDGAIARRGDPAFGDKRRPPLKDCPACAFLQCWVIRRRTRKPHSKCPGVIRARIERPTTFESLGASVAVA